MYSATKRTITLPTAYASTNYQVVASICKNRTKNTISGTGAVNLGSLNTTDFYIGVRTSDGTYGDPCCIITFGY